MKTLDLRKKTESELFQLLKEKKSKVRAARFNLATGRNKNVKEIAVNKREIAKLFTLLNEKKKHGGK